MPISYHFLRLYSATGRACRRKWRYIKYTPLPYLYLSVVNIICTAFVFSSPFVVFVLYSVFFLCIHVHLVLISIITLLLCGPSFRVCITDRFPSVCLSVRMSRACPNSIMKSSRKPKIDETVASVTYNLRTSFEVKRSLFKITVLHGVETGNLL